MKKAYMTPQTEVIEIKLQAMIAASDPEFAGGGGGSGDAPIRELEEELLGIDGDAIITNVLGGNLGINLW